MNRSNGYFDYSKLKGRTKEKELRQEDLAHIMGISPTTYSQKINNKSLFTQNEIEALIMPLAILPIEIGAYFFVLKV